MKWLLFKMFLAIIACSFFFFPGFGPAVALSQEKTDGLSHLSPLTTTPDQRDEFSIQGGSTTTTVLGLFRYLTREDFFARGLPLIDGTALLSDLLVGLVIDISNAQNGDKWVFEFLQPDGTVVRATLVFLSSFGGQRNCFTFGLFGPTVCGTTSVGAAFAAFVKCRPPGQWTVNLTFNDTLIFFETFRLVSAGPAADVQLSPNLINPQVIGGGGIPNIDPGKATVTVTVTDSGCPNIPISGATLELSSKTVPGSGGHAHLGEQPGTGTFSRTIDTTDRKGLVKDITYTAGVVGLKEDIIATVDPPHSAIGSAELTIAVQAVGITLSSLPASVDYVQVQSPTGEARHPANNFGTPDMVQTRILAIAKLFREERQTATGRTGVLSINDVSLPLGGVFDLCGDLTTCGFLGHVSHEVGIDVDINSFDSNQVPLTDQELKVLREIAEGSSVACRYIHAIHFRCDRTLPPAK